MTAARHRVTRVFYHRRCDTPTHGHRATPCEHIRSTAHTPTMKYSKAPDRPHSDYRQHRLEKTAEKSLGTLAILSLFLPPVAYLYVGRPGWALFNLLTLNYLLLGILLVPWHAGKIVRTAREEVSEMYEADD